MIYIDGVQDDTMAVSAHAGDSAVTQEIEIDCFDGHTFSLGASVANCVVEFRQEDEVSWHDLEGGGAYDLSPFDGTRETFQIRFSSFTAAAPQELKFRIGPAL